MTSLPMQHLGRLLALVMFLAALAGGSRDARADTAAAQALFDAAKQLMAQGKYADACPKLEESQRLDPGIGTRFNLAACYEQLGRTASAWSMFLEVAGAAKAAGQLEREKVARQRAAALEPKLIRLTITAPASAPADLQVKRDGALVGRAQWGIPVPVDPGQHTIEAAAPGRAPFTRTVELTRAGASETVAVPPLAAGAGPAAPATPPAATAARPGAAAARPAAPAGSAGGAALAPVAGKAPAAPAEPPTRMKSRRLFVTGIVLTGVGALVTLAGGVTIACAEPGACDEESADPDEDKALGGALVVGGIISAGVGVTFMIMGGRKAPVQPAKNAASAAPELVLGPRYAGLRWSM
ncbi:uncharacterized protein SOCE26_055910 [Sorangium cellulosum]|uniref:PEGA domain-containing protein n=1 Tax=Sorangium cellulosum TaxID=56 RepID=A0A2L0EY11_SORCE|nr:hypothetical protein [Sorangium cellulosum]AUX44129.1 uncharacterized protein SOCE26_055910 [Sorangium cellulosum]